MGWGDQRGPAPHLHLSPKRLAFGKEAPAFWTVGKDLSWRISLGRGHGVGGPDGSFRNLQKKKKSPGG